MSRKDVRVAVIGTGFMGRAHTNAYRKVSNFFELGHRPVLQAVCARTPGAAEAFAEQWGFASHETDWRHVIERDDIDAVDICTPNDTHREIAIAAAEAGKIILCEKPLARTAAEGAEMVAALQRNCPGITSRFDASGFVRKMLGDCSSELRAGDAFDISLNTASPSGLPRRDADWQLQQHNQNNTVPA